MLQDSENVSKQGFKTRDQDLRLSLQVYYVTSTETRELWENLFERDLIEGVFDIWLKRIDFAFDLISRGIIG